MVKEVAAILDNIPFETPEMAYAHYKSTGPAIAG
jgi:hypothetical protein